MGIENITYKTLVDNVVTYIKNNCYNISGTGRYSSLPGFYKRNYSSEVYVSTDGGSQYTCHITVTIDNNTAINEVSDSVNSNLTTFLSNAGFTNLNVNIETKDFISFFNNILSFCSQYLCFTTSQFKDANYHDESYLIYKNNGTPTQYAGVIDDIIYAVSVADVIKVLKERLNVLLRSYPVKYNYNIDPSIP